MTGLNRKFLLMSVGGSSLALLMASTSSLWMSQLAMTSSLNLAFAGSAANNASESQESSELNEKRQKLHDKVIDEAPVRKQIVDKFLKKNFPKYTVREQQTYEDIDLDAMPITEINDFLLAHNNDGHVYATTIGVDLQTHKSSNVGGMRDLGTQAEYEDMKNRTRRKGIGMTAGL